MGLYKIKLPRKALFVALLGLLLLHGWSSPSAAFRALDAQAGGNILVIITPDEVVQRGARWHFAEFPYERWKASNIQMMGITPGNYTLEFQDVDGYTKPASSTVQIVSGETLTINTQYILQTASLKVWIQPPEAVAAGGKWEVTSASQLQGGWHNSGETAANIPIIQTVVWLKDLETDAWNYPAGSYVYLSPNALTEITLSYTHPKGTIKADIQPSAAINAGAKWRHRRVGNFAWSDWHSPSFVLTGMRQTNYQVEFLNLPGWVRPDFIQFDHKTDTDTVVPGTYTMNMGSLMVTIEPAEARTAGALWRRSGMSAWIPSGRTITYIPAGETTVEFYDVAGWAAPDAQSVTIRKNQTASLTGYYSPSRATLSVNLGPAEAAAAGAKWRRVGTLVWHESGATEYQIPAGTCPIEFSTVAGWRSPDEQTVTLVKNTTNAFTATYTSTAPPGSLNVHLGPAEAAAAGAQWRHRTPNSANGSAWQDSEQTATGISAGAYEIQFKELADWQAPVAQSVTVRSGQTTYLNQSYERKTGSLKIQLLPKDKAIQDGGQWRRKGTVTWHAGNFTETDKPTGACTVEFKPVTGWAKPSDLQVQIEAGQVNTFQATYVKSVSSLTVTINPPEAASAGGMWRRAAAPLPTGWRSSGLSETGIAPGTHTVQFKDVPGWTKPSDQSVSIQAGHAALLTGTYTAMPPATGSLTVIITPPEAAGAGARWRVAKTNNWRASGDKLSNIVNDSFTVEFKSIGGWTKPSDQNVTINQGQNLSMTGAYIRSPGKGSLKVTIGPSEARTAGARWKLAGSTLWKTSGQTVTNIAAGEVGVEFKDVAGWSKPDSQTVQINTGQTASLTVQYIRTTGWLKVTLEPASARSAGAKWKPAGTTVWRSSGYLLSGLNAGSCAIEFKTVAGWNTPAGQTVTINAGQTATTTATYSRQPGSLKVNLSPTAAVNAGAQWRLTGTTAWHDSGSTLADVPAGACQVEFKAVSGWRTPSNKNVTIISGQTVTATGVYTQSSRPPGERPS